MRRSLSLEQARALALRVQGFGDDSLRDPIDVLDRLGAIQLDSVNVVARSHEIVPFSRLGPCSLAAMQRTIYRERRGFEYWGHMASWLPMAEYRYFLPRMEAIQQGGRANWTWRAASEYAHLFPLIRERIRAEGALSAAAFADPPGGRGTWWDPKPAKAALEILFSRGELMAADRANGFARLYDLPERVLPPGLDVSSPGAAEADRYLFRRAVAALEIATPRAAADYYRQRLAHWRLNELGVLRSVEPQSVRVVHLGENDVQEDEAGRRLAEAVAGPGLKIDGPIQSRMKLIATTRGIAVIDVPALTEINLVPDVSVFTVLPYQPVSSGVVVAGAKIVPMVIPRASVSRVERIAAAEWPVIQVRPFAALKVGVVSTHRQELLG